MRVFIACNNEGRWDFPEAELLILNGDLVNVFPKPPKPIHDSIAYRVAADETASALNDFGLYKSGRTEGKMFKEFMDGLFRGEYSLEAKGLYREELKSGLEKLQMPTILVHGNLDFPDIVKSEAEKHDVKYLDCEVHDGICGIGGIPSSCNPVYGRFKVFEAERTDDEYIGILKGMEERCRLLVTHMPFDYYREFEGLLECRTVVSAETRGETNEKVIVPPDYSVTGQGAWADV
ncbi:MAG: hypothetical protein ACE5J7_01500 [Candidatus Aenigmatarchaeota archaeon]